MIIDCHRIIRGVDSAKLFFLTSQPLTDNITMNLSAFIFAFLSAFLMGTIGVFSKLTGLSAEVITFFRLFFGAGCLFIFLACTKNTSFIKKRPHFGVITNGFFLAGFIIFYVQAMNYTTMANAIMLVYLAPVAASLFAHFFLKEKLTPLSFGLIFLSLFGFAMMMEFQIDIARDSSDFIGVCFGGLALFCYAAFILVNRVIPKDVNVYNSTFYQLLVGSIVMVPFLIPSIYEVQMSHLPWLVTIGLFPGFLAILFAVIALRQLPAATFGTIAYVEPVAVVIFGWVFFQEYLNVLQFSGCLLIIASGIIKTISAGK